MKIIFTIFVMLPIFCFAQKQGSFWYFGDHAGLDFNNGNPVVLNNGQLVAIEGTATISDSAGGLLFYTNGFEIWNKNHQVMPNGDSLMGGTSSTQTALIIPKPGSSRYFYIFTTDDVEHYLLNGLRYSIVDICANNGLGDVIINQKNILVIDTVAEKITGINHSNGTDYWLITHKYFSDAFYAFLITSSGIADTVISHVGSIHPLFPFVVEEGVGQLKASPNGQKLAIVTANGSPCIAEYFDFDKTTGLVSNCVSIATNVDWNYYGVSFSPDNSKLYIASASNGKGIFQFDLTAGGGNSAAVIASKTEISGTFGMFDFYALQLAIDGKIYCSRSPFDTNTFIGVINNPNNTGLSCNYIDSAISLNGKSCFYGFPNFIDSYDYLNAIPFCQTGTAEQKQDEDVLAYPNPLTNKINFNVKLNGTIVVILYDITFRKLFSKSFENSISLNTDQLAKGIYFYEIRRKNSIINKGKVVKE